MEVTSISFLSEQDILGLSFWGTALSFIILFHRFKTWFSFCFFLFWLVNWFIKNCIVLFVESYAGQALIPNWIV